MLTGLGAPRNADQAIVLLQPLVDAGQNDALMLLSETLETSDPENAYLYALRLAAEGTKGALARLDRLENTLGTLDTLTLQGTAIDAGGIMARPKANLRSLREAALAHLTGLGATRSYNHAYLWASLGATAGDLASASLVDEINTRMTLRGDAVAEKWATTTANINARALAIWADEGLGDAITGE